MMKLFHGRLICKRTDNLYLFESILRNATLGAGSVPVRLRQYDGSLPTCTRSGIEYYLKKKVLIHNVSIGSRIQQVIEWAVSDRIKCDYLGCYSLRHA